MPDDIFSGRCAPPPPGGVFVSDDFQREWRPNGTCSFCGGLRPSIALERLRNGAEFGPTDKAYKFYLDGASTKVYTNHFGESQAVELVLMIERRQIRIGYPGRVYSGLAFGEYKEAVQSALAALTAEEDAAAAAPPPSDSPGRHEEI